MILGLYLEWFQAIFCKLSYHFVFLIGAKLSGNFLKQPFFFQKRVQKIGFFNFLCSKFKFSNYLVLGLLKHYKNWGFRYFMFLLLKEKKIGKNDNWNFWICFCSKWPFRDVNFFFFFNALLKPLFL